MCLKYAALSTSPAQLKAGSQCSPGWLRTQRDPSHSECTAMSSFVFFFLFKLLVHIVLFLISI